MPPAAGEFNVDFVNEFFVPGPQGYSTEKKERLLAALRNPQNQTPSIADRITQMGLLEGKDPTVSQALIGWFAIWPRISLFHLLRLLQAAVEQDRGVRFVYSRSDAPVEIAMADFPTDPVTVIIRGVHP
jgi:hypothetical protein